LIENNLNSGIFSDRLNELINKLVNNIYENYYSLCSEKNVRNIHKFRVSLRKYLALLKVYKILSRKIEILRIYNNVYQMKNILGPIRETDVMLGYIEKQSLEIINERHKDALNFLFSKIKTDNSDLRNELFKNKFFRNFPDKINLLKSLSGIKIKKILKINSEEDIENLILFVLNKLYKRAFAYKLKVLNHPRHIFELHRMRVKVKPIRYLFEFGISKVYNSENPLYKKLLDFVETAGEIHEIDLIKQRLNRLLKEFRVYNSLKANRKNRIILKPIFVLKKNLNKIRVEKFSKVCKLIARWNDTFFLKSNYAVSKLSDNKVPA
jgi:CHAD domain-containing protein